MTGVPIYNPSTYSPGGGGGKRFGVVRRQGRSVIDDGGEFYPLGLTFMWSLQGARNEPDRYLRNLEWAAAKGFDFKRPLYEVAWSDPLKIDPATFPDHLGAIARDLDQAYGLGVRSGITLSGKGTGYDLRRLARDVGAVIAQGRQGAVLAVEMQNEYTGDGSPIDVLESMAKEIAALIPNLLGLSTPAGGGEALEAMKTRLVNLAIAVLYILHTERGDGDHGWRDVRQAWDFHGLGPLVGADWEGPGPGSSGSTNSNPRQLAMKRAIAVMCGAPIFILHTGTGVYGDGKPSSSGAPRPPNFWEIDRIDEIVSAVRGIDALLPAGLPNWQPCNTQWVPPNPVAPFQPDHHWEGDGELDEQGKRNNGVNKAYAALGPDGKVIQMPAGVRERVRLTASYPLRDVTVYDPITLRPVDGLEGRSFAAGEVLELAGGPWLDPDVAYIIHGRR